MKAVRKLMHVATILLFGLTFFFPLSFIAQIDDGITNAKDVVYGDEGVDVLYSHTLGLSLFAHSRGAGLNFRYGKFLTAKKSRSFAFDLLYTKDLREELTSNPVYPEALPYVFGKVNSMVTMRFCLEKRREITPKLRKSGVQVGWLQRYGATLGFLKPVYLIIGYPTIPYENFIIEEYNPEEHFYDDIFGRSSWINGVDQVQVVPGFHYGFGFFFEYGGTRGLTKSMEAGVYADVYLKKMEILASEFVEPNRFFLCLYLKVEIGSNWTDVR